jgi:nucleoside-diphosphate-sugar epimerase
LSGPSIAITGISGNLGKRLLPMLQGRRILGLDMRPPAGELPSSFTFVQIDLGKESSCNEMIWLFREHQIDTVIHLAFVLDPLRTDVLDRNRMWQINVAGTARVLEAISEINRIGSGQIKRLVALSSVSVYGPELPENVTEDHPLNAHTLTYAVHKKEMDETVRRRADALGECKVVILRPQIFVGHSMQNYMAGALKGDAYGRGWLGRRMQQKGSRLPMLLPTGTGYLQKKFQFVHVDDVARLIRHLVNESPSPEVKVLNVAARGESLTIAQAAHLTQAKLVRIPTRWLTKLFVALAWKLGISSVPPDSFPYLCGTYTMDTSRLRRYLGPAYQDVMRYTNESALLEMFDSSSDKSGAAAKV